MSQDLKINGMEFVAVKKLLIPDTDGDNAEFLLSDYVTNFATGYVNNVTAGQALTVTGITDEKTGEAFDVKGVLAFIQPTSSTNVYPANHASGTPAAFCFVRDNSRGFGAAMACHTLSGDVREVRLNTDISGITSPTNTDITFSGNSFTYRARDDMWGLIAASQWRWVAWG